MHKSTAVFLFSLLLIYALQACERPGSPDFTIDHAIDLPLISNITYPFLGGPGSIIDTTREDYQNIFYSDGEGTANIATDFDFNVGNFNDIVPDVFTPPETVETPTADIAIPIEATGEASFDEATGIPSGDQPQVGETIPGGNMNDISVPIEIDLYETGVISTGGLSITIENTLGFDIAQLDMQIQPAPDEPVVTIPFGSIPHAESATETITFPEGTNLDNQPEISFSIQWDTQEMTSNPADLNFSIIDYNLLFNSVTAAIPSLELTSTGFLSLDNSQLELRSLQDFIEVARGLFQIRNISNSIDLDFEEVIISFPNILMPPYSAADSLVIRLKDDNRITRNTPQFPDLEFLLNQARFFATNNELRYRITGITASTQSDQSDPIRTIRSTDSFTAEFEIPTLDISEVNGTLIPRVIRLAEDANGDGALDLFDENETSISFIDDFDSLFNLFSDLTFFSPELVLNFSTNIQVPNDMYAAIMGITKDGKEIFLKATGDSPFFVSPSDTIDGFKARGEELPKNQLLQIPIDPQNDPNIRLQEENGSINGSITFTKENSNVSEFLSSFPTEIRFVGKSLINPNMLSGSLTSPIQFNTGMSINIPMDIGTNGFSTFSDTLATTLQDLPGDERISEAQIRIDYINKLPLRIRLNLYFLDANDEVITSIPLRENMDQDIDLESADIDEVTRFSTEATQERVVIRLTSEQFARISETERIRIVGELATPITDGSSQVRIRGFDSLSFALFGKFVITSEVN